MKWASRAALGAGTGAPPWAHPYISTKHSHSLMKNPAAGTQRVGRLPHRTPTRWLCLEQVVGRHGLHSQDPEAWSCWRRGVFNAGLLWPVPVELGSRSVAAVPGAAWYSALREFVHMFTLSVKLVSSFFFFVGTAESEQTIRISQFLL